MIIMYLYIYACNYNMMSLYRILRSVTLFTRLSMVQGRFRINATVLDVNNTSI